MLIRSQARRRLKPILVGSVNTTVGGSLSIAPSLPGDLLIRADTISSLSIPGAPTGMTGLGAGSSSDASAQDASLMVSALMCTAASEIVPAAASTNRCVLLCFRNASPDLLTDQTGKVSYAASNSGTSMAFTGHAPTDPSVMLAFGRVGGTQLITIDDSVSGWNEIIVAGGGTNNLYAAWTGAAAGGSEGTEVASFSSFNETVATTVARVSCTIQLRGLIKWG